VDKTMLSFVNKEQDRAKLFTAKCVAVVAKKSKEHHELFWG
jgi:hypothetical protein